MGSDAVLAQIADEVISKLRGKVIIHRYDAFSTNSIYLKFDYGVANSLRISDHPGKKYLKYRFNILTTETAKRIKTDNEYMRIFYSPKMINAVCKDILNAKKEKQFRYRDYNETVQQAKNRIAHEKGFWQQAKEIMED